MKSRTWILVPIVAALVAAGFQAGDGIKRERQGQTGAAKDALEGKPPPPLKAAEWMNTGGKVLNWQSLKGSVILIDFWAHW